MSLRDRRAVLRAEASDGSSSWSYRRFTFTLVKGPLLWSIDDGILIPLDITYPDPAPFRGLQMAIYHEAGFYGFTRARLLRKVERIIDREIAKHVRTGVLRGRQPDARTVTAE